MKKFALIALTLFSLSPTAFALQVGISFSSMDVVFHSLFRAHIIEHVKDYPDMKIQFEDAQGAPDKQLSQVQILLTVK
ncbi:TPA: hypothetical protein ACOVJJ_005416 [Klebsiella oxytoca]